MSTDNAVKAPEVEGERRMLRRVLMQALHDAADTRGCATKDRLGARAWLRDLPGFTAKEVCEYLGVSYAALMKRQEARWATLPEEHAPMGEQTDDVEF